jgi:uncharacterized protein (TIGR01777 family)
LRIFLTGGTGFIGTHLVAALLDRGHDCVVVSRSGTDRWHGPGVTVLQGNPTVPGPWQDQVAGTDVVVNLAGARIVEPPRHWTAKRKALLQSSRIETTRHLVAAIRDAPTRPHALLSASAIGYYGPRGNDVVDESQPAGTDFLARLAADWEEAARQAEGVTRVVLMRGGLALGPDGGVLEALLPMFKLGLGGPWGSGEQWWSWIHVADQVGIVLHAMQSEVAGPLNLTAPNPVTVNAFAKALGSALGRPAVLRPPAFALRVALGEAAQALLDLQRVLPTRVLEAGYQFRFPELSVALEDLFGQR